MPLTISEDKQLAKDIESSIGGLNWFCLSKYVTDNQKEDIYGEAGSKQHRSFENRVTLRRGMPFELFEFIQKSGANPPNSKVSAR